MSALVAIAWISLMGSQPLIEPWECRHRTTLLIDPWKCASGQELLIDPWDFPKVDAGELKALVEPVLFQFPRLGNELKPFPPDSEIL